MKIGMKAFIGIVAFGGLVVSALGITAAISHHKATAVHALSNGYADGEYRYYSGNYYSGITDAQITTGGTTLLGKLHDLIDNGKTFGYENIWTFNEKNDCYPLDYDGIDPLTGNRYPTTNNAAKRGKMWDMYSDKAWTSVTDRCGNYSTVGDKYNREHSMPKSWFGGSESNQPGTDPNHLFNTDGKVNGVRSNYAYGEVTSVKTDCSTLNSSCKGFGKLGTNSSGMTVFEPDDAYKGDFARAQMYMATAYYYWNLSSGDGSDCFTYSNGHSTMKDYYINLLTKWSAQDPVSQKEIDRNNAVQNSSMGNRNPFIDHPTWANRIWSGTAYTWNNGGGSEQSSSSSSTSSSSSSSSSKTSSSSSSQESAEETLAYTLNGNIIASGNAYATITTLTQSGISWDVRGNTEQTPWRIGGKFDSATDRDISSNNPVSEQNLSKVVINLGSKSDAITLNSVTLNVGSTKGGTDVSTQTISEDINIADAEIVFTRPAETDWSDKYFTVILNLSETDTKNNYYVQLKTIKFYYGGESSGPDDPDPLPDPVEDDSFRKVSSEGALYAGDKIVVACNTLGKTAGSLSSSILGSVNSTFSNDKSVITDLGDETTVFTLGGSSGAWTFANDSDQLLGVTGEKKLAFGNGTTSWILTFGQNAVTMKTGNNNYGSLQYNSSYPRFTTYTSSQTAIQLYKQTKTIDQYCADFLAQTGEVCKTNNQTDIDDLTDLWGNLSGQFAYVNESNQTIMQSLNNAAMQRYDYIVSKYHFEDFIDRQDNGGTLVVEKVIYSTGITLAAIIVTLLGVAGGFVYFQKKRRENA